MKLIFQIIIAIILSKLISEGIPVLYRKLIDFKNYRGVKIFWLGYQYKVHTVFFDSGRPKNSKKTII